MSQDPESTADLFAMHKLARRGQCSSSDNSKLSDLVTQAPRPRRVGRWWRLCRAMKCAFTCFSRQPTRIYTAPLQSVPALLPPQAPELQGRKTLVLDLDETLVHSTFEPAPGFDLVVRVAIEGGSYCVYVKRRPGLEEFLEEMAKVYELVAFTASLAKYADPVLDQIDPKRLISHRLFREHCIISNGAFVKDLRYLGRDVSQSVIIDVRCTQNSPGSYLFHPQNAVPIRSFFDDDSDRELTILLPMLREMSECEDVTSFLEPVRQSLSERAVAESIRAENRLECNSPRVPK